MDTYLETLLRPLQTPAKDLPAAHLDPRRSLPGARMDIMQRWKQLINKLDGAADGHLGRIFMEDMRILTILTNAAYLQSIMQREFADGNGTNFVNQCYSVNRMHLVIESPAPSVSEWVPEHAQAHESKPDHIGVDPTIQMIFEMEGQFARLAASLSGDIIEQYEERSIAEQWEFIQKLMDLYNEQIEDEIDGQRT